LAPLFVVHEFADTEKAVPKGAHVQHHHAVSVGLPQLVYLGAYKQKGYSSAAVGHNLGRIQALAQKIGRQVDVVCEDAAFCGSFNGHGVFLQ